MGKRRGRHRDQRTSGYYSDYCFKMGQQTKKGLRVLGRHSITQTPASAVVKTVIRINYIEGLVYFLCLMVYQPLEVI